MTYKIGAYYRQDQPVLGGFLSVLDCGYEQRYHVSVDITDPQGKQSTHELEITLEDVKPGTLEKKLREEIRFHPELKLPTQLNEKEIVMSLCPL